MLPAGLLFDNTVLEKTQVSFKIDQTQFDGLVMVLAPLRQAVDHPLQVAQLDFSRLVLD